MSCIDCLMNIAVNSTSGTADSVIISHSRAGIDRRELMKRIMETADVLPRLLPGSPPILL